jgi:hypothetical protein
MKKFPILFFLLALIAGSSCTQKEEEQELDYDNMVMVDEEEEWTPGNEGDTKTIADLDPQEFIIDDPELKTESALGEIR